MKKREIFNGESKIGEVLCDGNITVFSELSEEIGLVQGEQIIELFLRWYRQPESNPVDSPGKTPKDEKTARQETPRFQIAVNLIVAQKMKIELPPNLIRRAVYQYGSDKLGARSNSSRNTDTPISCNTPSRVI